MLGLWSRSDARCPLGSEGDIGAGNRGRRGHRREEGAY